MRTTNEARAEAREALLKFLKPGDTVYTTLNHVSRSGMQREIGLYCIVQSDDGPYMQYLSGYAGMLLGLRRGKRDGLVVNGCGMDMGFHVVYELSGALFRSAEGWECTGAKCPSNDHSNGLRVQCHGCAGFGYLAKDDTPIAQPVDMGGVEWLKLREREGITACAVCVGRGELRKPFPSGPGVRHNEGGYALQHSWL